MSKVRPHSSCDFEKSLLSASRLKGSIFLPKTATWSLNVQPPSETFIGRLTKNLPKASKAKGTPTQFTILLWAKRMDPKVKNTLLKNFQKKSHIFFFSSFRFSPWIGIGLEFRSSMYPTAQFLSPCRIPKCRFKCQELAESTELKSTIGFSSPYKTKQNNSISAIWSSKPSVATISNRLAS